jgi:hypothetical protein
MGDYIVRVWVISFKPETVLPGCIWGLSEPEGYLWAGYGSRYLESHQFQA